MNRLATVKNLPSALDLQQSVQQLQTLMHEMRQEVDQSRQQLASLHSDLATLPQAVAMELSDLGRLSERVDLALRAQRQALTQTTKEMTDASLSQLRSLTESTTAQSKAQQQGLAKIAAQMESSATTLTSLKGLPARVDAAVKTLNQSTQDLQRSRAWVLGLAMIGSGLLSACLVVAALHLLGALDFGKPAPQSVQAKPQQPADPWAKVNELTRGK